ncbi:MAG TPA: SGNH/GDSL hydrolase family protein [Candidatus Baltobacteraceae bacterium]|nr:SGNH/GDSL hydrolase family protein [Candidatus Baltobacteraceae bacterium]
MHALSQPLGHPAPISMAVLGDSLAYGLGASAVELGLAHLLHARLRANRPASTLFTFAVPHSTMGDVLRHQVPHVRGLSVDLVLVVAGANDLRYTRDVIVITRRFRNLLEAIHDAAPGAQVVAGGMPDVTQTIGVPRLLKAPVRHLCERLSDRMRGIAHSFDDGFIDMFQFTNAPLCQDAQYLCDDGFHPNDFGYAEIAQRAYPALEAAVERIFSA